MRRYASVVLILFVLSSTAHASLQNTLTTALIGLNHAGSTISVVATILG